MVDPRPALARLALRVLRAPHVCLRPRRLAAVAGTAAFLGLAATSLSGSSSKFFQAATQAEFLKGEVDNLSIDSQGRLVLGPAAELVYETSAPFLWAVTPGPDGTLFVG